MACSAAMSKRSGQEDSPRSGRPGGRGEAAPERTRRVRPVGDLVGDIGGQSFKRFGFVQHSIVSRWSEIVGERYARASSPESIKFPAGKKAAGVLTLLVDGAHAPLIQHLTPMIVERVNRFFGYAAINRIVFRQGKPPLPARAPERPQLRAVPKELGEGLREIADLELRRCLESLAVQIAASSGPPSLSREEDDPIPVINRSE
jgi:hypothetical protein